MASFIQLLPLIVGILGNIISFCVFLAPLPTFYRIYKKKSTQGFQAIPYSVALFSCMLLLYYGYLKTENGMIIITINSIGCAIEIVYIILFLLYATKESLAYTAKLLILFNIGIFGLIIAATFLFAKQGPERATIVGWMCAVFSVCVFAAPLSIMRLVIKTKSVEYMPFSLSFFLTICAVIWFFYGLLIKDYYVATPNVLGFVFGVAQMILYMIYKDNKKQVRPIVQPKDVPTPPVVDLEAIFKTKERSGVELGVILGIHEKDAVILEIQEQRVAKDGVNDNKKEEAVMVCSKLDSEKPIVPSIDHCLMKPIEG